jgi:hypothetical protein
VRFVRGFRKKIGFLKKKLSRAVWADALAGLNAVWMERLVTVVINLWYRWEELLLAVILVVKWWIMDNNWLCKVVGKEC